MEPRCNSDLHVIAIALSKRKIARKIKLLDMHLRNFTVHKLFGYNTAAVVIICFHITYAQVCKVIVAVYMIENTLDRTKVPELMNRSGCLVRLLGDKLF